MFLKLAGLEIHFTKDIYTCVTCNKAVCMMKCEGTSTVCTRWGCLIVSKVNQGHTSDRGVPQTGLRDAGTNDASVPIHRSEE